MSRESEFIDGLRGLATSSAARGLIDDVAVLEIGGTTLVLTQDMIVEGVHFLPDDPPQDVAWKLLAVNLSDLAAKAATPVGVMLGYSLRESGWDRAFTEGLRSALEAFGIPLLGGDTVSPPPDAPGSFVLTAIGRAVGSVPSRAGAKVGDHFWVSGSVGDAGAGLRIATGELSGPADLVARYRQPRPRLEAGQRLAPLVTAMMDVSDGLLIDASRLAQASGCRIFVDLAAVPLSDPFLRAIGGDRKARLFAATAGDDYELLFTAPADASETLLALSEQLGLPLSRVGSVEQGSGLRLTDGGEPLELPASLGFEHD